MDKHWARPSHAHTRFPQWLCQNNHIQAIFNRNKLFAETLQGPATHHGLFIELDGRKQHNRMTGSNEAVVRIGCT